MWPCVYTDYFPHDYTQCWLYFSGCEMAHHFLEYCTSPDESLDYCLGDNVPKFDILTHIFEGLN